MKEEKIVPRVMEDVMHLHFNCYLEGRKATDKLMAQDDYRKAIYKSMKGYYIAYGCCLNFIEGKMKDAVGNILERKLYRQEVKRCGRMATEEMDRLLSFIKRTMVEYEAFGGDDYQYWQDIVDAMESRFLPKIQRLQDVMETYMKKFSLGDEKFRASICVVTAMLHYAIGTVYKDIRANLQEETLIDINDIFPDGDGKKILAWWSKMEEAVIYTDKEINFDESKACHRALESFVILFSKTATFRMPMRLARKQRALRHPEVDWKAIEREEKLRKSE